MRGDGRKFLRGKTWWIAYYVNGVEKREPGGRTEKEALKKLKLRLKQLHAHQLGLEPFKGPEAERITVDELLNRLQEKYAENGSELRRSHSHMKHLRVFFAQQRAMQVTSRRLSDYIRFRRHHMASDGTVNRELRIVRAAFNLAAKEGRLSRSSIPYFELLPEHNTREGFAEKGDIDRIIAQLSDTDVRDYVLWGYWTGMRKSEIGKLTWAAFDKETWMLTLPGRSTKNKKPRKLALLGTYREIIKRRLNARVINCDLIFHRNGKPIGSFRKAWLNACKKAGVAGLLFHDLRRSAIRNMVRAGIERTVARSISGHATESVFIRYNIVNEEDLRDAALKTEAYVSALSSKTKITPLDQAG